MKRLALLPVFLLLLWQCGQQQTGVKLQQGTPEYDLGKTLSEKVTYLDPAKNEVLVSSNEFNITSGEIVKTFYTNMGNRVDQLKQLDSTRLNGFVQQTAQQLGEKKLLLAEAKKANISATDAEVDSILQMQYQQLGGKDKFEQRIQSMGVNLDLVKEQIHDQLTIQNLLDQKLAERTNVTEEDIDNAYNAVKTYTVRHILLSTQGKSDSAKQAIHDKMASILDRARNGEDFGKLAEEYSEDPGSKDKGGLYKDVEIGTMVPPFEEAALNTPIGKISDIVETRYGYHIIKVVDRKSETKPLAAVHDSLKTSLEQSQKNNAYQDYMSELKDQANFEVHQF